jgi:DNA-binding NtrC family response regulator
MGNSSVPTRVLVVDDEAKQLAVVAEMLSSLGFTVATASDGKEALDLHAENPADVILTDLIMPRMDGFEFLRNMEARGDRTPTIVLTGFGNIEKAISVVHDLKAFWFLEKPVQPAILRTLIERAATQNHLIEETEVLNRQLSFHGVLGDLVGGSTPMRQVFSLISQVAPTTASVLITGESGTGKELVARALHRLSPRAGGPFVPINCAALTETLIESELFGHEKGAFTGALERHSGCFEQANNGTVFLDEIGDMPFGTQAKLLRVLEERKVRRLGGKNDLPVEVRVVAATNKNPEDAIKDKLLREDLFYRLNVFSIFLPPLRDRKEDIAPISEAILVNLNKKHGCRVTGLHPAVLETFQRYAWPGNVRELRNMLERAAIIAGEGLIMLRHLAMDPTAPTTQVATAVATHAAPVSTPVLVEAPLAADDHPAPHRVSAAEEGESIRFRPGATMEEIEETYINLILQRTNNNKTKAAEILGISVRTLHNRLGQLTRGKASSATSS